jgi:phage protein D
LSLTSDLPLVNARPRVSIDGSVRAALEEAALEMEIQLPHSGMSHAELRLLNWGPSSGGQPDFLFQDIRPGSRMELFLGESDGAAFSGEITAMEERYGDGAPQLVLLAEDALHRLARQRHNRVFETKSLDDVIRSIAAEAGLQSDSNVSSGSGTWIQGNESNLAFLMRLLAPHDVCLRLQDGYLRARDHEPDPVPVALNPASALTIRIIADLNRLPVRIDVNGYSLESDSEARGSEANVTPAPNGRTGASLLAELGWEGAAILPHPFARSQQEADALAGRQFRQRVGRFLHGEIVCQGNSDLRCGREVQLADVSPRLAGRYRVMVCRHSFDMAEGLRTRIRIQRPDWSI